VGNTEFIAGSGQLLLNSVEQLQRRYEDMKKLGLLGTRRFGSVEV